MASLLHSPAARRLTWTAGRLAKAAARLPHPSGRALATAALVAAGLIGGFLVIRDAAAVRVNDVFITGLSSNQEPGIRASLRAAAQEMTTLHVRKDRLLAAVSAYSSVADLRVDADFPHKLSIEVVERVPVGVVLLGDRRVPVTAGGLLLHGVRADDGLAVIRSRRGAAGERLSDPRAIAAVEVLAAAPQALRRRAETAGFGNRGLLVELRDGPDLVFGSAARAKAKWLASARVLADPTAAGATYLDLRIPERVGAGGLQPVESEDEQTTTQAAPQTTQTTQATTTGQAAPVAQQQAPAVAPTATPQQTPTPEPGTAAAGAASTGGSPGASEGGAVAPTGP